MAYNFHNLVFEGGGVLGVAYAGVVQELESRGILENIERVVGTSAGAICALSLALRYPVPEIRKTLEELDFKLFVSKSEPLDLPKKYGWYSPSPLRDWLAELVHRASEYLGSPKELDGTLTFEELRDLGGRELYVFATDLNTRSSAEFSHRRTPRARVVEAVLASSAIPGFFQSVKFSDNQPDAHIYVDGGVLNNFPIMTFDTMDTVNEETIGFKFERSGRNPKKDLDFGAPGDWAEQLYETVKNAQSEYLRRSPRNLARTAFISAGTIKVIDFDISDEEKQWLIENGRRSVQQFLRAYDRRNSLIRKAFRTVTGIG